MTFWSSSSCSEKPLTIELIKDFYCECWDSPLVKSGLSQEANYD